MSDEVVLTEDESEEVTSTGGELVPVAAIQKFIDLGTVMTDLDREKLPAQRARWENGETPGDRSVAAAYRAVEDGRQLVDLHEVIVRGGVCTMNQQLPALAVAPAFAEQVNVRVIYDGQVMYRVYSRGIRRLARPWQFEVATQVRWDRKTAISHTAVSIPPAMPPDVREVAEPDNVVMWEATWQKIHTKVPRPPIHLDPALLEHVTGSLWVVKKTWDLTPLEAAALR